MKLLCQALVEKVEINDDDKKTLSDLFSSFEFNCYILGKVLADRKVLEANIEYVKKRTSIASLDLKKFDSNAEKIQKNKDRKVVIIKELRALDDKLKVFEPDQGTIQVDLLVLNTELVKIPSKHEESISRQKFIASHC